MELLYVDTSAYLSLLLGEKMSSQIEKICSGKLLCSSTFLALEAERNLVRLAREKVISEKNFIKLCSRVKEDVEVFILKELDFDLCLNGVFPAIKTPRSSDLVHLRTALWFAKHHKLQGFLTLDQHQKEAASELKLKLL